ncbi:unnamed protein product [Chrysoparadoxa australica]
MREGERKIDEPIDWDQLDKKKFYFYGISCFLGVRVLLYPTFLIKTIIQVAFIHLPAHHFQSPLSLTIFLSLPRIGIRGLYKGFWVSSLQLVFRQGYFTLYELLRRTLGPGTPIYEALGPTRGEVVRNIVSGGGASVIMQVATVPVDVVTQNRLLCWLLLTSSPALAGKPASTALAVASSVYKAGGFWGFYKGFSAAVFQFAPTSAIWWSAFGFYQPHIGDAIDSAVRSENKLRNGSIEMISQGAAGFCAGATTVVLTNPLDVIRTRLQVHGTGGDNKTIRSELKYLLRTGGPGALMKGLVPRLISVAPSSTVIILVYSTIKKWSKR